MVVLEMKAQLIAKSKVRAARRACCVAIFVDQLNLLFESLRQVVAVEGSRVRPLVFPA
jgi:hypothetical protein